MIIYLNGDNVLVYYYENVPLLLDIVYEESSTVNYIAYLIYLLILSSYLLVLSN